jgi:hypothetical protein
MNAAQIIQRVFVVIRFLSSDDRARTYAVMWIG